MAARKTKKAETVKAVKAANPEYFAAELIQNCEKIFGPDVSPDCAAAALRMEKLEKTSILNAKRAVNRFMKKEVI